MNVAMQKIQQEILNLYDKKTKLVVLALDEFDVLFYDKRGNPSDFIFSVFFPMLFSGFQTAD